DSEEAEGRIQIYVKGQGNVNGPDYEASVHEGDLRFSETFRRLQHTCVKEFIVGIRDSPFLRYWKAQEGAAFTVVSVELELPGTTDYDVLDSIVNHLRPRTTKPVHVWPESWHENGYNSERLKFLARQSFLNNLQTCCLTLVSQLSVYKNAFPAPAFFLKKPGYPNYELRQMNCNGEQVADGIDRFIESFVRDGCANDKLESVYFQWEWSWYYKTSLMPKQLNKLTEIDLPVPKNNLIWLLYGSNHRVTQCETQSFVNKKQWKRMEVFKWSVEYPAGLRNTTTHLLQCLVKNL
ncbi:hypothetical protein AAVH_37266, partial [Aphelenchoides avenae]